MPLAVRAFLLFITILLLSLAQPASAAFPVSMPVQYATVTDTPVTDATVHYRSSYQRMHELASHKKWYTRKDLAAWAMICAVLGIAAAVAVFYVVPISVAGAIILGVLSGVCGFAAFGLSEMDILSAHWHKISVVSLILGIIQSIPLAIAAIPFTIILAFIPRTHSIGHKNN